MQEKQILVKEKSDLQELLGELGRELQQAKADVGESKKTYRDLSTELEVLAYICVCVLYNEA